MENRTVLLSDSDAENDMGHADLWAHTTRGARGTRRARVVAGLALGAAVVASALAIVHARKTNATIQETLVIGFDVEKCTTGRGNCNVTKCCADAGMQCYTQDALYAQCRASCNPGPDPTHWDEKSWNCEALGGRSNGTAKCADPGTSCLKSRCCKQPGTQCFKKHDTWATCKADCVAGAPDTSDLDGKPWSCEKLGEFTPGAQGWVWQKCAAAGETCKDKKCCIEGNAQCYSKAGPVTSPYWAECKQSCNAGEKANPWEAGWDCKEIGTRTPAAPSHGGLLAAWAQKECSKHNENCQKSRCCVGVDALCYEKNSKYATCKTSCTPGKDSYDNNDTWTCKELSARGHGLAVKGTPSLFCFSLMRSSGYEFTIMEGQVNNSIGIFECDEAALFSADGVVNVGKGPDGKAVPTIKVDPAVVRTTADGTAGNAKLFANLWDKVIEDGRWRNHAWTVKADPDAVLVPARLRWHMAAHTGEKVYVLNCNKFPESPNFPMMFGSVEIFSFQAMETFSSGKEACKSAMGQYLESWGEDYYLGKCMDLIHVGRIADFGVVGDSVCTGADCNNQGIGSFHAFKSWDAWADCHKKTRAADAR